MMWLNNKVCLLYVLRRREKWYNFNIFRPVVQDPGNLLVGLLPALHGSLHVLRKCVQHMHEAILHFVDDPYYLLDEVQAPVPHDLRFYWWLFPSLHGLAPRCIGAYVYHLDRLESLGIHLELLPLAGVISIHSSDCDASQNQSNWEPDIPLRCHSWPLQVLLHPKLVSDCRVSLR
jgi:hypothetical protein